MSRTHDYDRRRQRRRIAPRQLLAGALWLFLSSLLSSARAQTFGVTPLKTQKVQELLQRDDAAASTDPNVDVVAALLGMAQKQDGSSVLEMQEAIDLALILQQASRDPETLQLVLKMKTEEADTIQAILEEESSGNVLVGLKQLVEELKMVEVLFEDPQRGLELMQEEGMIQDEDKLAAYRKDPKLLEDDTRKGVYFMLVSLAVAAGFL